MMKSILDIPLGIVEYRGFVGVVRAQDDTYHPVLSRGPVIAALGAVKATKRT